VDAATITTIVIPVVALTQFLKWAGLRDRLGAAVVLILSAAFVALWVYSRAAYERTALFDYVAAWVVIATSAAGTFGFTRAASDAVTSATTPPAGAGQSPTVKS
jgi:hypothetical protein